MFIPRLRASREAAASGKLTTSERLRVPLSEFDQGCV
jgi:hypothetical protein